MNFILPLNSYYLNSIITKIKAPVATSISKNYYQLLFSLLVQWRRKTITRQFYRPQYSTLSFYTVFVRKIPRNSILSLLRGIALSHKFLSSPDNCLNHIRVLQLFSKLADYVIDHMLTPGHVPPAIQPRKSALKKAPNQNAFLPHKPIPTPHHSFYIPIPDLPPDLAHHVHDRRSALISRLFPDCFVDCRL